MGKIVSCILLAVVCTSFTAGAAAQSGKDSPRFKQQHKAAGRYQKRMLKQQKRQQKQQAKRAKAYRNQHSTG